MKRLIYLATALVAILSSGNVKAQQVAPTTSDSVATVYFIKEMGLGTQKYVSITIE